MSQRRHRLSLRRPVTIFVIILVLMLTLTALWHVRLVHDYQKLKELASQDAFHWTFIAVGSLLFVVIIVLSSILGAELFGHIRWRQRQSNFLASVSHELNSPLSSIKLFAQTLRRPDLEPDDRLDFVNKILFDVERLQRLISNILRSADADSRTDELQVVVQRVQLDTYLEDFLRSARRLHAGSGIDIRLEGDRGLWLELDVLMFRQVLDNLVDNAVRYHGETSPDICLEVRRQGGWAEIRLQDQGLGVAEADLPKLFERFFRAETVVPGRRRRAGTGIGLYVVRTIIQAHGGRVRAESAGVGKGLSIIMRLPLVPGPQAAPTPQEEASPESGVPEGVTPDDTVQLPKAGLDDLVASPLPEASPVSRP